MREIKIAINEFLTSPNREYMDALIMHCENALQHGSDSPKLLQALINLDLDYDDAAAFLIFIEIYSRCFTLEELKDDITVDLKEHDFNTKEDALEWLLKFTPLLIDPNKRVKGCANPQRLMDINPNIARSLNSKGYIPYLKLVAEYIGFKPEYAQDASCEKISFDLVICVRTMADCIIERIHKKNPASQNTQTQQPNNEMKKTQPIRSTSKTIGDSHNDANTEGCYCMRLFSCFTANKKPAEKQRLIPDPVN